MLTRAALPRLLHLEMVALFATFVLLSERRQLLSDELARQQLSKHGGKELQATGAWLLSPIGLFSAVGFGPAALPGKESRDYFRLLFNENFCSLKGKESTGTE